MAAYGALFTAAGIALFVWDARLESGDVNDIFDLVSVAMMASGALVTATGMHAILRGPSTILLALVFFLHIGPTFTFGTYALIFWGVT